MKYTSFTIENYRAIKQVTIDLESRIVPLVGVNECGKTTILQAIYCFDTINDKENEGQHLNNITNLYSTVSEGDGVISADIKCSRDEIMKCVSAAIRKKEKALKAKDAQTAAKSTATDDPASTDDDIPLLEAVLEKKDAIPSITISRNLSKNGRPYSSLLFDNLSLEGNHIVCEEIVRELPFILYNDDFNDRPVSEISLESDSGWKYIFERVFLSANKNYDLDAIVDHDDRRRKSILLDVESHLSKTLTDAWSKFSPYKQNISISLDVDIENKLLQIYIKEQIKNQSPRIFAVTDRSKGFIWYYNFIMKIKFNPKESGTPKETVFLLDEPGSYLHETAQADLCKKLRDISAKEGVVLYCTHSPQLLNPQIIPLNSILIVEKNKGTHISATQVSAKNDTKSTKNTAMQPIYEALMIPEYQIINERERILCVEGIYDKYCIESFCDLPDQVRIFPSTNAESLMNNISYFIAYSKPYLALWDNDPEGKKVLGKAKKNFGSKEAENFALLPDIHNLGKVRMEEMIQINDYDIIRSILKLPTDAIYETIICTLYYANKKTRNKVISEISDETKKCFSALQSMIEKHFSENEVKKAE